MRTGEGRTAVEAGAVDGDGRLEAGGLGGGAGLGLQEGGAVCDHLPDEFLLAGLGVPVPGLAQHPVFL